MSQIVLPPPGYPMVTRVVTSPMFGEKSEESVTWTVTKTHPLIPDATIVRMFVLDSAVEVYAVATGKSGTQGIRNFLPMHTVKLIEEAMPIDIFSEELEQSESDNAAVEDESESETENEEKPGVTVNGVSSQPS